VSGGIMGQVFDVKRKQGAGTAIGLAMSGPL
jgi:hypothetical protein